MRVIPHDPERTPEPPPERQRLTFTRFRVVPLGRSAQVRIDLSASDTGRTVSVRLFKSKGRGRPLAPEHPWHVFPEHLPALIAALTEAAAALAALPPINPEPPTC